MKAVAVPNNDLNQLWGTQLQQIHWSAHRAEARFELIWTDNGQDRSASLVFTGIRYSRLEFDELAEHHGVVELVSVEAEECVLGTRVFGELSNGTFEFVSGSFCISKWEPHHANLPLGSL